MIKVTKQLKESKCERHEILFTHQTWTVFVLVQ